MFERFWAAYPRKVSKKMALKSWLRLSLKDQELALEALPKHVEFWKVAQTELQYIPHPSTWLSQERFFDELELPKPKLAVVPAWWTSEQGTIAMASKLGLSIRPGEGWDALRQRIREKAA